MSLTTSQNSSFLQPRLLSPWWRPFAASFQTLPLILFSLARSQPSLVVASLYYGFIPAESKKHREFYRHSLRLHRCLSCNITARFGRGDIMPSSNCETTRYMGACFVIDIRPTMFLKQHIRRGGALHSQGKSHSSVAMSTWTCLNTIKPIHI
jgi:hypothetical protein